MLTRPTIVIIPLLLFFMALGPSAWAGPKAELWERWTAHDPASTIQIDHSAWDQFLAKFLRVRPRGGNLLDYAGVDEAGRAVLDGYLDQLSKAPVDKLNRDEQMAYWFNVYNALTVQVILDHWPVKSIRDIDISPGLFSDGPWGAKLFTVEGEKVSLDEVEHRILRPIWKDPRIHYGVNCASIGCPDLAPRAYRAEILDAMLDKAAKNFIADVRGVKVEEDGQVSVSKIYDWFEEDFGDNEKSLLAHLGMFAEPDLKSKLESADGVEFHAYDWKINAP